MSSSFQLIALPEDRFAALFDRSDAELHATGARRMIVDQKPGFPCRVSLVDAEIGETVILLPFTHHDVSTPYRSSGPIFIRGNARTLKPAPGEIPEMFRHRLLSVRAYDISAMMIAAEVVKGNELEDAILRLFTHESAHYLHIHNAQPGCYNCSVVRAR
jgi:uncharacterized protein DUF1203